MMFQCAVPGMVGLGRVGLGAEQVTTVITYPGFDCDPMTQVCGTGPAGPGTGPVNVSAPPGGGGAVNILDLTWGPSIGSPGGTNPGTPGTTGSVGPAQPGHVAGKGKQTWGTPDGTGGIGIFGVFKLPDALTPKDAPEEIKKLLGLLFWGVVIVGGMAALSTMATVTSAVRR